MRRGNKISFASNTESASHATILSQTLDTMAPDEHPSSSSSSSTSDQHPTALCCIHRLHSPPSLPSPPLSSSSSSFGTPVLSSLFSNSPDLPKTQSTPELRLAPPPSLFSFHPTRTRKRTGSSQGLNHLLQGSLSSLFSRCKVRRYGFL
ncbi:uncharacterized protein LOC112194187 [Rosa chinensis]|uniref:uncharacterized protein LOC112194187 n=1 Tax=Rosa chinensis TaxID=74649 RepID=UPI001AD9028E|nr:uncharacterized protein LOC112194187 [Rosa chinensis]